MNPLDELKAAVVAQQELLEELKKDAEQCQQDILDAHSAWVAAKQRLLKRMAPRWIWVDGVLKRDPTWIAPTEAALSELRRAIESRRAELLSREEAAQTLDTSVKQANDRLTEMRQTWPPILGPFPTRNI
ncbi:hypothetical protein [Mycobacterium sp.]|uniref:hypothetical protein n=1 Tax=Mycobacterium sp. TaxID=1785 RepID=UPI003F99B061